MAVKLYFETLTKGMHAKLNSRYVYHKQVVGDKDTSSAVKAAPAKAPRTGFLGDAVNRALYRGRQM
jgi:hypothetical protein